MRLILHLVISLVILLNAGCSDYLGNNIPDNTEDEVDGICDAPNFEYVSIEWCDGQIYPNPLNSAYIIPFAAGT